MKKYFILFIAIFLLSCTSKKQQSVEVSCPEVYFSKDHRVYITTQSASLSLDNVSYRAEINNFNFTNECLMIDNNIVGSLSILFVIESDKIQEADIILPYYIAILDDQRKIVDIQYYKIANKLEKNKNKSSYIETEVIVNNDIKIDITKKLLIGFMLDQKKTKNS